MSEIEYISKKAVLSLSHDIYIKEVDYRTRVIDPDAVREIPAADVWEVVHCADCAHAEESLVSGCVYCNEMKRARIKEGFCAWGERKANDG